MNDADRILGPKPAVTMPTARKTHFGRYPDVQDLCDTLFDEMAWELDEYGGLDNYTTKKIAAGARDYRQAIGGDTKRLLKAIKKMKIAGLSIASPRSCITTARRSKADSDSVAGRRKYETDFWEVDDETE